MNVVPLLLGVLLALPPAPPSEKLLLPVSPGSVVKGANGSVWFSELVVLNAGDYAVTLTPLSTRCPPFECFSSLQISPGKSVTVPIEEGISDPPAARILLAVPDALHLHLSLRAFRNQFSPGASIPVVRW